MEDFDVEELTVFGARAQPHKLAVNRLAVPDRADPSELHAIVAFANDSVISGFFLAVDEDDVARGFGRRQRCVPGGGMGIPLRHPPNCDRVLEKVSSRLCSVPAQTAKPRR